MYVLFSVLQISDALLGSFGADMLEALNCSAARVLTDERRAVRRAAAELSDGIDVF